MKILSSKNTEPPVDPYWEHEADQCRSALQTMDIGEWFDAWLHLGVIDKIRRKGMNSSFRPCTDLLHPSLLGASTEPSYNVIHAMLLSAKAAYYFGRSLPTT